ncbi:MAG TPA: F0F1 ATP synthase subunit B, partial [Thermoanaerobaculia bacterium]|nr:F0F1 ATP synthase subunit B [Thermoanaerobaculia bacterium]
MRKLLTILSASIVAAFPLAAQEADAPKGGLLTPSGGLMLWTLVIFIVVLFILSKFAYPKILEAVEAREKSLSDAIAAAKKDREEAAALLAEHQKQLAATRDEAQKIVSDARAAGEKVRADVIEQAHKEQQTMLERARAEIVSEKDKALAELRKQTVELAVRAASKVIERNLDVESNRAVVESFLASIEPT